MTDMRSNLTGHKPTDDLIIKLSRESTLNIWQAKSLYLAVGDYELAKEISRAYEITGSWRTVEALIYWTRTSNPSTMSALDAINQAAKYDKWYNRLSRWIKGAIGR